MIHSSSGHTGGHRHPPRRPLGGFDPSTGAFRTAPGVPNATPHPGDTGPAFSIDEFSSYPDRPNTFAVLSLVFAFIVPIAGVVLGLIAKNQLASSDQRGDGMALAGIIVGAVFSLFMITIVIFTAISYAHPAAAPVG